MSTERYPRKAVIAAPEGLTPKLKTKSRGRREQQRALAEIAEHTPKRRNDLLPKLAVSYVPIDELRQAPPYRDVGPIGVGMIEAMNLQRKHLALLLRSTR